MVLDVDSSGGSTGRVVIVVFERCKKRKWYMRSRSSAGRERRGDGGASSSMPVVVGRFVRYETMSGWSLLRSLHLLSGRFQRSSANAIAAGGPNDSFHSR